LNTINTRKETLEDHMVPTKKSGYRSIHILAGISYNNLKDEENGKEIKPGISNFVCEIQSKNGVAGSLGKFNPRFSLYRKRIWKQPKSV